MLDIISIVKYLTISNICSIICLMKNFNSNTNKRTLFHIDISNLLLSKFLSIQCVLGAFYE